MPEHAMQWAAFGALAVGLLFVLLRMTRPAGRRNRGPSNRHLTDYGSLWQVSDDAGHHHGIGHDGSASQ